MGLFRKKRAPEPAITINETMGDPAAAWLRARLAERDWPAVRDFLGSVTDFDDRAFYFDMCGDVSGVQEWIPDVVAAEPESTVPLLLRGVHGVHWAWEARGSASASRTSAGQFREFARRLKVAEDCLDEVVERDPDDTTAWTYLLLSGMGRGVDGAEMKRRFGEVVSRHPGHQRAHRAMFQYLCAKWYGSDEAMFGFVGDVTATAPDGSPLHGLVASAYIEKWCRLTDAEEGFMTTPEVVAELHAAADRSVRHPGYSRGRSWPRLHNEFAFVFTVAHEWVAADEQLTLIGDDFVTRHPWSYFDDAVVPTFLSLRATTHRAAVQLRREGKAN